MKDNWSLVELYKGFDDTDFKLDSDNLAREIEKVKNFANANFKAKDNPKQKLETYINMYSDFDKLTNLSMYTRLVLATESENATALKIIDNIDNMMTDLTVPDTMFKNFLLSLDDLEKIIEESELLKEHRFMLREAKETASHLLPEQEEFLMAKLKLTGSNAWTTLFEQLTSTLLVEIVKDGKTQKLPLSAVRNMYEDKDAQVRKTAYEAEINAYPQIDKSISAALNAIKGEAINTAKLRGYESVLDMTLKNSRMDKETLDALLGAMKEYIPVFSDFFKHKAKLLGNESGTLPFYDLSAPVGELDMRFTREEAAEFISNNFREFSKDMGKVAESAFENNWIDWYPKEGKLGGAFCANIHSIKESRILMNFSGSFGDMLTLAHELGHAYHGDCLKNAKPLNSGYTMPIAETASTFCETLVCQAALKTATPAEKLVILENNIQSAAFVVVDIYSRFLFEDEVIKRREQGTLSVEELKDIMADAQQKAYGDRLDKNTLHPYMWLCKPHYYDADYNYYNYPYAYGLLFALGLYSKYLEEGESFTKKYSKLLEATGKNSLYEIGKIVDIDVRNQKFWNSSFEIIKEQINEFIRIEI